MTGSRIRVFAVDDHPTFLQGLAAIIDHERDMRLVAQASTGREAVQEYRKHSPDVTLMDVRLPDISGIDALIAIRAEAHAARILMLTTFEGDAEVHRALKAGASGYMLKNVPASELVEAIRHVHAGRKSVPPAVAAQLVESLSDDDLTAREIEVLRLVAEGSRNRQVAERLFISEETVKVHVKHVLEKLGAADRTQAVTIAIRRGIIHL